MGNRHRDRWPDYLPRNRSKIAVGPLPKWLRNLGKRKLRRRFRQRIVHGRTPYSHRQERRIEYAMRWDWW